MRTASALTLVEVCAALLVLVLGFTALIGLVSYGMRLSAEAQGRTTGYATAQTVLADVRALEFAGNAAGSTSGFINGYWVQRTRTADPSSFVHGEQTGATILVQVFDGQEGGLIAELRDHVVEQP